MSKVHLYLAGYALFSVLLFAVILHDSLTKSYDFFTLMQELTDSHRLAILLNFIVYCIMAASALAFYLVFGQLRRSEWERVVDKLPFYVLNLLFILFNDNTLLLNVIWLCAALVLKVWHIVAFDRIELFQVQLVSRLSHQPFTRIQMVLQFFRHSYLVVLLALLAYDVCMTRFLAYDVFQGVELIGSLLLGMQFGVMAIDCFAFLGKLVLDIYELIFYRCSVTEANDDDSDLEDFLDEQVWELRALFTQAFLLVTVFLEMAFYLGLFYAFYYHVDISMPFPIIQGCIGLIYSASKKIVQFKKFMHQSRRLDNQLAAATEEELAAADHMCIICREDMHHPETFMRLKNKPLNPRKYPKLLPCGHILHLTCLKDWLERSDSCPLCRQKVFQTSAAHEPTADATNQANNQPQPLQDGNNTQNEPAGPHINAPGSSRVFPGAFVSSNVLSQSTPNVPRDWMLFPITATSANRYTIQITPECTGLLTVRPRDEN